MTPDLPVMFRAGGGPEEAPQPVTLETHISMAAVTPTVKLADVSEFQPNVDDPVYLRWSQAVIFRALYGAQHIDHAWFGGDRRKQFHDNGAQFVGIYQYVVASQPVLQQAAAMVELLGSLQHGEVVIADIEEGSGDLAETWHIYASTIAGALGDQPWDYSGLNFAAAHGLAPVRWVAAYGQSEPSVPHTLWQFTDRFSIPGVGVADCSLFHGTIDQLAALAHSGSASHQPTGTGGGSTATSWQELIMSDVSIPVIGQGATGEPVRTIQGLCQARHQNIKIDGDFGPVTKAAVEAVQRAAGFTGPDVDGIVGRKTWPALLGA